ncbi:MAG: YvcK family protein [Anaerolineae bacterium]|nr:YvcK family protein [Anaerolineae bacterium]
MEKRVKQAQGRDWHTHLKWLQPGLGIKRWLALLALGVVSLSLGVAFALRSLYPLPAYFYYLTLQFLPRLVRAGLFVSVGSGCIGGALWGLNRTLLAPFVAGPVLEGDYSSIPEVLYDYRRRGRGPKIVVLGGGHGQSSILRGLKHYTSNLTAIVTVADDGGSSGRLRRDLGILPPGDFRNCIAALADDEALVTRLFQYRFASGAELSGHSFGNLFISAMAGITGSFEDALQESSQVLAVKGRVFPSTLQSVTLCADIEIPKADGQVQLRRVCGESEIPKLRGHIQQVSLEPTGPLAYPGAVKAILEADLLVIGPGSMYTSILPNLLVPEIARALRVAQVPKVYVCNVATQIGETEGYTAAAHLAALERHIGSDIVTAVIVNNRLPDIHLPDDVDWVVPDLKSRKGLRVIARNLVDETPAWRHDSRKIAAVLVAFLRK